MTYPRTTEFETLRSQFWAQMTLAWYGRGGPKQLEQMVRTQGRYAANEAGGRFADYLKGSKPFRSRSPVPRDAIWVDRCAKLWPHTGDWFYTPMWYLLDRRAVSLETLIELVRWLPSRYQDVLLEDNSPEHLASSLNVVVWPLLTDLSYPLGPWSLGALACAMRRLELAGDLPGARRCAIGLMWSMQQLAAVLPPKAGEVLRQTSAALGRNLASPYYLARVGIKVSDAELESFAAARSEHLSRYQFPSPLVELWAAGWGQSCTSPAAMWKCPLRC
ncbi:MAG: hypothetical protein K9J82_10400 [Methylotenera sp.]|nr:hypothetical protein [Methylotenera sp.]